MLGHVLWRHCSETMDAYATVRATQLEGSTTKVLDPARTVTGVRVEEPASVAAALDEVRPEVAVNCIGVVKQSAEAADRAGLVRANSLFPHELAAACATRSLRLIHVSTDCVFSGRRGGYVEEDLPDPIDAYGRSKLAGEVSGPGVVTLRTSMIGRELGRRQGLLEWIFAQDGGAVRGYERAIFSGPTVAELARAIALVIDDPDVEGLFHVGAAPISKLELLEAIREAFSLDIEIEPSPEPVIDRSLQAGRFRAATGWAPPSWPEMIAELATEAAGDVARR
jgi:dTDP-4-dehydrorhamnose reductase